MVHSFRSFSKVGVDITPYLTFFFPPLPSVLDNDVKKTRQTTHHAVNVHHGHIPHPGSPLLLHPAYPLPTHPPSIHRIVSRVLLKIDLVESLCVGCGDQQVCQRSRISRRWGLVRCLGEDTRAISRCPIYRRLECRYNRPESVVSSRFGDFFARWSGI